MKQVKKNKKSVRNGFGVKVKCCCASCQYKDIEPDGTRVCKLMEMIMPSGSICKKWDLEDHLKDAGKGWGRIKKKEYLAFVLSVREEENRMIDEGLLLESERASTMKLRLEYRQNYGSEYEVF